MKVARNEKEKKTYMGFLMIKIWQILNCKSSSLCSYLDLQEYISPSHPLALVKKAHCIVYILFAHEQVGSEKMSSYAK